MEATQEPQTNQALPLLRALLASGLPLVKVLAQAECLGISAEEQLRFAETLVPYLLGWFGEHFDPRHMDSLAHIMVFGYSHPSPVRLLECCDPSIDFPEMLKLASDEPFTGEESAVSEFEAIVLRTVGYPVSATGDPWPDISSGMDLIPWLDSGRKLHCGIDLAHYETMARFWKTGLGRTILLHDGEGPESIHRTPSDLTFSYSLEQDRIRMFRIRGLKHVHGIRPLSRVVAVACPDLATLDEAPEVLVLIDCPSVDSPLYLKNDCRVLHLERCPGIHFLQTEGEETLSVHGPVTLADCRGLHRLPRRFSVSGRLMLRRMGSLHVWPTDFSVGGDLILKDCLGMEELPPVEVGGSVRVEGDSSLRHLAPGTVVSRHLDLRACHHLESLPRGIQVGGKIFLPPHLHREPSGRFEAPDPLLDAPRDLYPELRTLLMGLRFPELVAPSERFILAAQADLALEGFRAELIGHPRLETELLWIASEVWSDLAEERWEQRLPHDPIQEGTDELPLAWFRDLLHRVDPATSRWS